MINKILRASCLSPVFLLQSFCMDAQDNRTQIPSFLSKNVYFEVNIGYINYPFSNQQMEPGYRAESVHIPHVGVRLVLFGYRFNKYLSAEINYLRPVNWVQYKNINGDQGYHSVPTNVAGLSVKSYLPVSKKFSVYGEGGLGVVTRTGFKFDQSTVVKNANYISYLLGAGLQYHTNDKWNFMLSAVYSPAVSKLRQPSTVFFSGGVRYTTHPLSAKLVEENRNSGFFFPKNMIQVGFTGNAFGYGVNDFVSNKTFPIFWGGDVQVRQGFSIHYQHNVFHGRKLFSFDLGASFSYLESRVNKNKFYTLSVFPLFRFALLHTKPADLYFNYSLAGPAFISLVNIDNTPTGKRFTFQDFMGMGVFIGKHRNMNVEINIAHYSNGDLFPDNNGVKVPLTFNLGYTF